MLDRFIASMPGEVDGDLTLCRKQGLAYQSDRTHSVEYGPDYWAACAGHPTDMVDTLNAGRIALVNRYLGVNRVVDIGIGAGEFIRARGNTVGRDINPIAIAWLKNNDLWAERLCDFAGVTMWDSCEHIPVPEDYFKCIPLHAFLFVSIPIFSSLDKIRESRHYRPGEHLQYYERWGFINWMDLHGFKLLEETDQETLAGRDSILSFAFKRYRWPK